MDLKAAQDELTELEIFQKMDTNPNDLRFVHLLCRHNFLAFCKFVTYGEFKPFDIHRVLCNKLDQVARGEVRKLILASPPRSGKSLLTAQLLPAYILGRSPRSQNILSSYGKDLSREHAMKTLDVMTNPRYKYIFPEVELKSREVVETIRLKNGGVSRITSAGSKVTGKGFGILESDQFPGISLADDLLADGNSHQVMNSTWAWTTTQLLTRKLPNNAMIFMGTRFAKNDITGRIIDAEGLLSEGGEWDYLNIEALCTDESTDPLGRKLGESHWPQYFPVDQLESTRRQIGEKNFQSLYQGNPLSEESAIFKANKFCYYTEVPNYWKYKFCTIDSAFSTKETADESVICIWGISILNKLYLINVVRGRFDFPQLVQQTKSAVYEHSLNEVCIENKASGQSLIQVLEKEIRTTVTPLKANQDKITRANAAVPIIEAGDVWVPGNAHWMPGVMEELTTFPLGSHDDVPDCFAYGVLHFALNFRQQINANYGISRVSSTRSFSGIGRGSYAW